MRIAELFKEKKTVLSFEIFPPSGMTRWIRCIRPLTP